MMVIPLENCSRKAFRTEEKLGKKYDQLTDIFASGVEGVEMVQIGKGAKWIG